MKMKRDLLISSGAQYRIIQKNTIQNSTQNRIQYSTEKYLRVNIKNIIYTIR